MCSDYGWLVRYIVGANSKLVVFTHVFHGCSKNQYGIMDRYDRQFSDFALIEY